MIGTALRLGLSVGLNHNIPPDQCPDPVARENRVRVWWTIYGFDRFWGLKLGLPVQVADCDVHVDLPSDMGSHDEFTDCSYQIALIKLAKVASKIMRTIYSRATPVENFLQREQAILVDLKQWLEELPVHLRLQTGGNNPRPTISIHLQFNYVSVFLSSPSWPTMLTCQCVILAIRPILLSMLDHHYVQPQSKPLPPALSTLSEACIGSARQTLILCAEEWSSGSLPVYGYAFAQYIFTSSLVLVISSLLPCGTPKDHEYIETASEMLRCLVASGRFVAQDFSIHLHRVRDCSSQFSSRPSSTEGISLYSYLQNPPSTTPATVQPGDTGGTRGMLSHPPYPHCYPMPNSDSTFNPTIPATPNLALYQPGIQDILSQSVLDIDLLQPLEFPGSESFINPYVSFPLWDNSDI